MYPLILRVHLKIHQRNDAYAMFVVFIFIFLIFLIKAYFVGTHFNCIDKLMQFKWVSKTYAFIRKGTKSTLAVI